MHLIHILDRETFKMYFWGGNLNSILPLQVQQAQKASHGFEVINMFEEFAWYYWYYVNVKKQRKYYVTYPNLLCDFTYF